LSCTESCVVTVSARTCLALGSAATVFFMVCRFFFPEQCFRCCSLSFGRFRGRSVPSMATF
jgi:hypothetical protein